MHITTGTMTSVLDTLERNGYVKRLPDPDDRRRVLVEITPAAQDVLNRLLPEVVQTTTAALSEFSPKSSKPSLTSWGVFATPSMPFPTTSDLRLVVGHHQS